jgi:hypothetical protein
MSMMRAIPHAMTGEASSARSVAAPAHRLRRAGGIGTAWFDDVDAASRAAGASRRRSARRGESGGARPGLATAGRAWPCRSLTIPESPRWDGRSGDPRNDLEGVPRPRGRQEGRDADRVGVGILAAGPSVTGRPGGKKMDRFARASVPRAAGDPGARPQSAARSAGAGTEVRGPHGSDQIEGTVGS